MKNQAFFNNIRSEILSLLSSAENEILIAMAWFTNTELLNALIQCLRRGVRVKLILLDDVINHCDFGADFNQFISEEGSEFYLYPPSKKFMHHKFCVIDNKTLITGSYNWTNYAESRNLENVVVTNDTSVVEEYTSCFNYMKMDLIQAKTFEILSITQVPDSEFASRMMDFAQEVYSIQQSESQTLLNHFQEKTISAKVEVPESIKSYIGSIKPQLSKATSSQPKVIVSNVENFRYAVSKFNIGFKANLIDQGGREGLKVMIEKGQALPFTITRDAKSDNAGAEGSNSASCEFYYGDSTDISKCMRFGDILKLDNLPNLKKGEVKFKIVMTLDDSGSLSVKFVCTNTGNGVEGKHTNKDFIEYRYS